MLRRLRGNKTYICIYIYIYVYIYAYIYIYIYVRYINCFVVLEGLQITFCTRCIASDLIAMARRLIVGFECSNLAEDMDVRILCLLFCGGISVCDGLNARSEESYRACVSVSYCVQTIKLVRRQNWAAGLQKNIYCCKGKIALYSA